MYQALNHLGKKAPSLGDGTDPWGAIQANNQRMVKNSSTTTHDSQITESHVSTQDAVSSIVIQKANSMSKRKFWGEFQKYLKNK